MKATDVQEKNVDLIFEIRFEISIRFQISMDLNSFGLRVKRLSVKKTFCNLFTLQNLKDYTVKQKYQLSKTHNSTSYQVVNVGSWLLQIRFGLGNWICNMYDVFNFKLLQVYNTFHSGQCRQDSMIYNYFFKML